MMTIIVLCILHRLLFSIFILFSFITVDIPYFLNVVKLSFYFACKINVN